MAALAMPKDDWTPADLKKHQEWRREMFKPPQKPDVLAARIEAMADPERAAIDSRVRDLEMVVASLRMELDAARKAMKRRIEEAATDREPIDGVVRIRVERIIHVVAMYYGVSVRDIKSARRTNDICAVRHVAAYLCKELTLRSLPEIGRHLGGRDHTTAMHSVRKIAARRLTDAALCQELAELEAFFA